MSEIKVYKKDKWVDLWVSNTGGKKFSWYISVNAPKDEFNYNCGMLSDLYGSGLSSVAKGIFSFILFNRFLPTRVCLYGQTTIAKMYGCANKTARKALKELEDNNIISSLKVYTGKNISYQYYINDYKCWSLPENSRVTVMGDIPAEVIEYSNADGKKVPTFIV